MKKIRIAIELVGGAYDGEIFCLDNPPETIDYQGVNYQDTSQIGENGFLVYRCGETENGGLKEGFFEEEEEV